MTEKMFIHIKQGVTFTDELKKKYTNSIVFDDNTGTIWTHEKEYGSVEEALAALKYFSSVVGNSGSATPTASKTGTALNIKGKANDYVETVVNTSGVTIQGTEKLTTELSEAKAAGTAASSALETYKTSNDAAVKAAKDQADKGIADAASALAEAQKKVASVKSGSNGIAINGTATDPTVALKIDTTTPGNVTLTETANGLKASVEIEEVTVPVTDIADDEKVLSLANTKLSTTLKLSYDNKKIRLLGKNDVEITSIPADAFIKDGMLQDVEYDQDTHTLSFTFNTDAGEVTIDDIDLSDLVDVYEEGKGIEFTDGTNGKKINVQKDINSESFLSVSASGIKISGVQDAIDAAKDEVSNYTINDHEISTRPVLDGTDIKLTGYSKGSDSSAVAVSDTVNEAIGKLENQIASKANTSDALTSFAVAENGSRKGDINKTWNRLNFKTGFNVLMTTPSESIQEIQISLDSTYFDNLFAWEEL